jgi:hypothetical protein
MHIPRSGRRKPSVFIVLSACLIGVLAISTLLIAQAPDSSAAATNLVERLQQQLERGETTLEYTDKGGYLPDLLRHLDLNVDSQLLVFSKTSFQQPYINPKNPRALYFNDQASVGTVPGADYYEIVGLEPTHGMAFYTLTTKETDHPQLEKRSTECVFCHAVGNRGALSLVVASVIPKADGEPIYTSSFISTIDDREPFGQRWGGWYVTGTHGSQRHMGNAVADDPDHPLELHHDGTQNVTSLAGRLDTSKYLTDTSDIVALMVLAHQVGVVNRLTSLTFQYNRHKQSGVTDDDWKALDKDIDDLVGYMLFVDEARLTEPVKGVSTFTETFPQRGPRDSQGRSLRDFDLKTRMFRYPLSYMIYSQQFDGLPASIKDRVYRRLFDVLTGKVQNAKYATLSAADRQAVLDILIATKPSLPSYWTSKPDLPSA